MSDIEWVNITVEGHTHKVAKPVADELGLKDGDVRSNEDELLDRIIECNWRYIQARHLDAIKPKPPLGVDEPE